MPGKDAMDAIFTAHHCRRVLSTGGGAEASTICHARSGWKKFKDNCRVFSHNMKWKLYTACVRNVILYGSKVWPLKQGDISRIS